MIYTASVDSREHIEWASELGIREVVVSIKEFSREGGLAWESALELANECRLKEIEPVLLVDRLIEERDFDRIIQTLEIADDYKLRVQDIGLANWLHERKRKFQLLLDVGNANTKGILRWKGYFCDSVERFVLNNEIPEEHLLPILSDLGGESELLGLGPVMIYYSPRKLFAYQGIEKKEENVVSDETGQKTFRCKETDSGFVMYYSKELCLLPYCDELNIANLGAMRLDFRTWDNERFKSVKAYLNKAINYDDFKKAWPESLLHGYYKTNKSDSVFEHLPKRKKLKGERIVAEVLDQSPYTYLLKAVSHLNLNQSVKAVNTKGELVSWDLSSLKNLNGEDLESVVASGLTVVKKQKKIFTGGFIYAV